MTAMSDFWPPNVNVWMLGSQKCEPADAANLQGNCRGAGGIAGNKVNKETGLAPDSCGAHERNEFREPRGLIFPYTEC